MNHVGRYRQTSLKTPLPALHAKETHHATGQNKSPTCEGVEPRVHVDVLRVLAVAGGIDMTTTTLSADDVRRLKDLEDKT